MTGLELKKLSIKINYLLDMNGGCTDEYIEELMELYRKETEKYYMKNYSK